MDLTIVLAGIRFECPALNDKTMTVICSLSEKEQIRALLEDGIDVPVFYRNACSVVRIVSVIQISMSDDKYRISLEYRPV